MNNTDSTFIQLFQDIQETLHELRKGQEELAKGQEALVKGQEALRKEQQVIKHGITSIRNELNKTTSPKKDNAIPTSISNDPIPRPVSNITHVTWAHILNMMSNDLGIEVNHKSKSTVYNCTKIVCDQLADLPSVRALGPSPSWKSISKEDKDMICTKHAVLLKEQGIDFTRCQKNWASVARIGHLWQDRYRRRQ
ncbi:hypothetical protein CLU79DRAFT_733049 [Phycomyces nitens]|nr:hypothetical protein CLU79DRAFT_733049 [Phycomyces nitens]